MVRQSIADWCCFMGENGKQDPAAFFRRCREIGFTGAEMVPPARRAAARSAGLQLLNSSGPGMTEGLNRTANHAKLLPEIVKAMEDAQQDGIASVIIFSGNREGQSDKEGIANCVTGIRQLLPHVARTGVTLLFELLNVYDHVDYQAAHGSYGFELVEQLGSPGVKLLYDVYHLERMGDDYMADIKANLDLIGHFHMATAPDRTTTADSKTANYKKIGDLVSELGYYGYFGQEFITKNDIVTELERSFQYVNGR